jgi:hypothetical protein
VGNWQDGTVFPASDDTKKKMYSSILVVGGGLMFHKAQEFLQHRILNKMPPSFRRIIENVDVITRPKVSRLVIPVRRYSLRPVWLHRTVMREWGEIQARPVAVSVEDLEKCEHDFQWVTREVGALDLWLDCFWFGVFVFKRLILCYVLHVCLCPHVYMVPVEARRYEQIPMEVELR